MDESRETTPQKIHKTTSGNWIMFHFSVLPICKWSDYLNLNISFMRKKFLPYNRDGQFKSTRMENPLVPMLKSRVYPVLDGVGENKGCVPVCIYHNKNQHIWCIQVHAKLGPLWRIRYSDQGMQRLRSLHQFTVLPPRESQEPTHILLTFFWQEGICQRLPAMLTLSLSWPELGLSPYRHF